MSSLKTVFANALLHKIKFRNIKIKKYSTVAKKELNKSQTPSDEPFVMLESNKKFKVSKDVLQYLAEKNMSDIQSQVSPFILKIHRCAPYSLYLVSSSTAKHILNCIGDRLKSKGPIIEVNPGFGCLTRELLNYGVTNIKLYEASTYYKSLLKSLENEYPERIIDYYIGDFFGMWKLAFQDKKDGGNRLDGFLGGLETKDGEGSIKILGAMPSLSFISHLLMSVIFQNNIILMGRSELFILLPPSCYHRLIPQDNLTEEQSFMHRPTPVLINLLFDIKLLAKVPRKDFLPWQKNQSLLKKKIKQKELLSFDQDYLYLIHLTVKPKLPCKPENLPLLWFFFKQHIVNKTNRIIPMLEQWIPGCGIWLITGQDPPGTNQELAPSHHDAPLPHITIFTQFCDLTPAQKLTLFKKFISWPEFNQSPFLEAMDNHFQANSFQSNACQNDEMLDQDDETSESPTEV